MGLVRVAGLPAFPADRAAGILRPLSRGQGAAAGAAWRRAERPDHPYIAAFRECQIYEQGFVDEANVRRAIAAYFGLVSFTDHNVGRLIGGARRRRPHRRDAGPLFGRSRRQSRHPRAVGQIDDVRGIGRGADDRRRAGTAAGLGLPRAGDAGRLLSRRSSTGPASRRSPKTATCPACRSTRSARRRAAAHDTRRIPRDRRGDRRLHDPQGAVQVRLLRRHAAAAFRSRRRPAGSPRPRRRARLQGLVADCEAALRPVVDPEAADALAKSDQARAASPRSAGARRSSTAAASPIRRRREPSDLRRRDNQRGAARTTLDENTAKTSRHAGRSHGEDNRGGGRVNLLRLAINLRVCRRLAVRFDGEG